MVCVKLLVVDVDGVLANDANVLREVKKKYPNITQLFHAKESHHVHFEGPQLDIINASNDVYAAAGEPFALPAEHARFFVDLAVNYSPDAIEKLLVGLFRQTEKFARDDKLRPGWRVSGPMYGVCASTPERRRELMELCIAKINVTYNVKLTLDVLVEFQTSVPTSVERATALALSQIERGTAASRLSVWQTNDISNHSPNAMVTNQGFVQPQKLCAPPHVGSAIIVAAPFSSHLLFGFGQNDVSPTNEEAEVEELFKEILNARSHHELFRTAHATSSAEAHVPFPFWNAPLVPQSSAFVNNVYRPHTEFQTNVEQAAALTAIPPRTVNGDVTSRVASWPTNNTTTQTHPILMPTLTDFSRAATTNCDSSSPSRVLRTEAPQFVPPGTSLQSPEVRQRGEESISNISTDS